MRFAAGRGAVADRLVRGAALAELLLAGNRRHRGLPAGAPWQSKGTAVAERHREDVAYCSTADAELLLAREPPAQRTAGRGAAAEQGRRQCTGADAEPAGKLAGAPRRSKGAAARLWHGTALLWSEGADNTQASPRSTSGQQSASAAAGQWRWQKARAGAGRQILSDSPSDLAITSAAQVLPYVFTAVRGISQSC